MDSILRRGVLGRWPIVLALLLAGCAGMTAVHPAAQTLRPEQLAAGSDIDSAETGQWPDARWWTLYADPQLDRLMDQAAAGNPRLAAAQARIAAAEGMARISHSALEPSLQAGVDVERTRFSQDYYIPGDINGHDLLSPIWSTNAGFSFSYTFDFWGRDRAALEASLDAVKVSRYEAQGAHLALEGAVLRAYAELSYVYEIRDHEAAILDAENRTLDLANRRLKAGLGTELEIQQARNAVAATRAQLEEVENRMVLLRHQLAALCGEGPGAGDTIARPTMTLNQAVGLPTHIPAELIGRRPDVLAERWRVESAASQIEVAKAQFYPNVDLKAALGVLGFGFDRLLSVDALNSSIGPAVTLPIFEGGKLRAGLDVRTAQYDAAVDAYNATVVEALHEVADQISRLESLRSLRERRRETLSFAQRAHELAAIAFRAGLTDYNNVLSTEDALNRAQNLIAEVGLEQMTAVAALNQALGGGLIASSGEGVTP